MSKRSAPSAGSTISGVERAWRAVVALGLGLGLVPWLLMAWVLWALRCDENCGAGDYDRWQYTGQAVLAGLGALLAILAVVLGFTSSKTGYWITTLGAIGIALVWVSWVLSGSF